MDIYCTVRSTCAPVLEMDLLRACNNSFSTPKYKSVRRAPNVTVDWFKMDNPNKEMTVNQIALLTLLSDILVL